MAVGGLLKYAQRAIFSKPTPERRLIKLATQQPVRRVVELGIDSIENSCGLLNALVKRSRGEAVCYTAIDPFDERPPSEGGLRLVEAYRRLASTGVSVRLIPGSLAGGVAAEANSLIDTDLLLIGASAEETELSHLWFYIPRMCRPGTLVLRRASDDAAEQEDWSPVSLDAVSRLASDAGASRAA